MGKIRVLVVGVLAATTVAACSSSGGSGSPSSGSSSGPGAANFCKQLSTADQKLTKLGSVMQHPQDLAKRLNPVISEFESLKSGAPAKVSSAIDDLLTAMKAGEKAMQGGNPQAAEKQMMKLAPKLEHDAGVIGQYVSKKCGH